MAYLLDANVFIQAKNLHYGLDFCPAFWDWLIAENAAKKVFSIEKVDDEILAGADQLAAWASGRGPDFFLQPDNKLLAALSNVSAWATGTELRTRRRKYLSSRSRLLFGRTRACHGHTVATHEVASTSTKRIKIPDACIALGIKCVNPYEMLRTERARFVLGTTKT